MILYLQDKYFTFYFLSDQKNNKTSIIFAWFIIVIKYVLISMIIRFSGAV